MGKRYTNEINWRRVFHFAVPCILILILFVVGPVNYAKLEHIQLDAGVLESAYVSVGAGLLYILLFVVLKYISNIMRH